MKAHKRIHFLDYPTIPWAPITKGELFSDLDETFDYALPQSWLNYFVQKTGLDYDLVRSTTVWLYQNNYIGPITVSAEVADAIITRH